MAESLLVSFVLVFAIIGGTEFIDRTSFALIGLAARHRPAAVWAGGALAFVITTGLAVVIGTALTVAVGGDVQYLRLAGGLFLIGYAGYLWFKPEKDRALPTGRSAFTTAFLLILLLEMGDTTQILIILFVSTQPNAVVVGVAGALALILVAASATLIGSRLGARVEPELLEKVVVVILLAVGTVTVIAALDPSILPAVSG
jgi:putative Ca2+/H+ antiporter (TMEM165/GDT1 family)